MLPTEWSLNAQVCNQIWDLWGVPQIDLFATRWNARLPRFCSPMKDPAAVMTDAFLMDWSNQFVYAFPPYSLVRKVLNKFQDSRNCRMILIAPWWPQREWLPDLYRLSSADPVRLPLREDLLSQVHLEGHQHQGLRTLALTAWSLQENLSVRKDFLSRPPRQLVNAVEVQRTSYTKSAGNSLGLGV